MRLAGSVMQCNVMQHVRVAWASFWFAKNHQHNWIYFDRWLYLTSDEGFYFYYLSYLSWVSWYWLSYWFGIAKFVPVCSILPALELHPSNNPRRQSRGSTYLGIPPQSHIVINATWFSPFLDEQKHINPSFKEFVKAKRELSQLRAENRKLRHTINKFTSREGNNLSYLTDDGKDINCHDGEDEWNHFSIVIYWIS